MLFNSPEFLIFFIIVFYSYWQFKSNLLLQNLLLLVSSYIFYGLWDYRFLFLLIFSTLLDYTSGILIFRANKKNKKIFWLVTSIGINLSFLFFFKYFNFFTETFSNIVSLIGGEKISTSLNIVLPVGISFYTFHGLSYVLDIYNGKVIPTKNIVNYSLFVSFFPLLVAGPIERATHLLPQIEKTREFQYTSAVDGLKQILWGLFKKVVIADLSAEYVNLIFGNYNSYPGSMLLIGAILFSFQIYCDFSGYSDIALGTARMLGIDLLRNFSFPYFSRDIAEFWRRWHISLTTWFRDYIYIPLGGSKVSKFKQIRNTFVVFLISGFWHGANWTFIIWGLLNAFYFLPLLLTKKNRNNIEIVAYNSVLPTINEFFKIVITFLLVSLSWIFFRAPSLNDAFAYISKVFSFSSFEVPKGSWFLGLNTSPYTLAIFILFFLCIEWAGRRGQYALQKFGFSNKRIIRHTLYYLLILLIFIYSGGEQHFIYFQF